MLILLLQYLVPGAIEVIHILDIALQRQYVAGLGKSDDNVEKDNESLLGIKYFPKFVVE